MKTKILTLRALLIIFLSFSTISFAHQNMLTKSLYVADIDNDGTDDFIKITNENSIRVYKSDFEVTAITNKSLVLTSKIKRLIIGDFFGKGNAIGIFLENRKFHIYGLNVDKSELLWAITQESFVGDDEDVIVGDFDGDSRDEILVHNSEDGKISFFEIGANGFFSKMDNTSYSLGNLGTLNLKNKKIYVGEFGQGPLRKDLMVVDKTNGQIFLYSTAKKENKFEFWWAFTTHANIIKRSSTIVIGNIEGGERDGLILRDANGTYRFLRLNYGSGNLESITDVESGQLPKEKGSATLVKHLDRRKTRDNILFMQGDFIRLTGAALDKKSNIKTYWWAYTSDKVCNIKDCDKKMTSFDPKKHGFQFVNNFKNGLFRNGPGVFEFGGLCGGMVYSALDYFHHNIAAPDTPTTPRKNSPLESYIYSRQQQSFWPNADKWAELTVNPFGARDREFFFWGLEGRLEYLVQQIDRDNPLPLGLYTTGNGFKGHHQVLAIGYDLGGYTFKMDKDPNKHNVKIFVYDPNHPNIIMTLRAGFNNTWSYHYENDDNPCELGREKKKWRTYFVDNNYAPKRPKEYKSSNNKGVSIAFLGVGYKRHNDDCSRISINVQPRITSISGTTKLLPIEGNTLVEWNTFEKKNVWNKRANELVHYEKTIDKNSQYDLGSKRSFSTFLLNSTEDLTKYKLKIKADIKSCHKSCDLCPGFNCSVKSSKSNFEWNLGELIKNSKEDNFFDTNVVEASQDHKFKIYFSARKNE